MQKQRLQKLKELNSPKNEEEEQALKFFAIGRARFQRIQGRQQKQVAAQMQEQQAALERQQQELQQLREETQKLKEENQKLRTDKTYNTEIARMNRQLIEARAPATVYFTRGGSCYHNDGCNHLKHGREDRPRSELRKCKDCFV